MTILQDGTQLFEAFGSSWQEFFSSKVDICGINNTSDVFVTASARIDEFFCTTAQLVRNIRYFFTCKTWYPLYEITVHQAMCYSAADGFSWIASTQFVIVFMAVIVLTFRSSLYDLEMEEEEPETTDPFIKVTTLDNDSDNELRDTTQDGNGMDESMEEDVEERSTSDKTRTVPTRQEKVHLEKRKTGRI